MKEIANRLAISENTVKCHIKSVTLKLDCYSFRDMKTAFVAHLVIHSLLDAHQGMEGDNSAAK
jgi:DNA-binding NarL/FixJ family response regulator